MENQEYEFIKHGLQSLDTKITNMMFLLVGGEFEKGGLLGDVRKMQQNQEAMEDRILQDQAAIEARLRADNKTLMDRVEKLEKWKDKLIYIAIGAGVGTGLGISKLIEYIK